ncbi:MAG: hypothetical protein FWD41_00585, partial [Actinomycetia bacterium]|nr:hypothetical protein [Actinomycetes bacterium]
MRLLSLLIVAVMLLPTVLTGLAFGDDETLYHYPGHGTSSTTYSVSDGSSVIGTFCVALHIANLSSEYSRVDNPGDNEDEIAAIMGVDAQTLAEIRHAIAEMRTLYTHAGSLSLEQVQQNILPDTAGRAISPKLTQNLIWYRQYLSNPDFFRNPLPSPFKPFTAAEQAYYYDGGLTLNDRIDVILVEPDDTDPNEYGYLGPFTLEYKTISGNGSTLEAINNNGTSNTIPPTYSTGSSLLASYSAAADGSGARLQKVTIGDQFWVKPLLSGGSYVSLYPDQHIILGIQYESIFVDEGFQTQFHIEFDFAQTLPLYVGEGKPSVSKTVSLFGANSPAGDQSKYLQLEEDDKALFSMSVTNNSDAWPIDYLFVDSNWPDTGSVRRIYTPAQLAAITDEEDIEWRVMNNLDLTNYCEARGWPYITLGEGSQLNGQGYTISGLDIREHLSQTRLSVSNMGLISVNNGTIHNLAITDFSVIGARTEDFTTVSGNNIGAIVATNNGTIRDLDVSNISVHGVTNYGGITGTNNGDITNLTVDSVTVNVACTGSGTTFSLICQSAGGIAGTNNGTIEHVTLAGVHFAESGLVWGATQSSSEFYFNGGVAGINTVEGAIRYLQVSDVEFINNYPRMFGGQQGARFGGIAGNNLGVIEELAISDVVLDTGFERGLGTTGAASNAMGGIVGHNPGGVVRNAVVKDSTIVGTRAGGAIGESRIRRVITWEGLESTYTFYNSLFENIEVTHSTLITGHYGSHCGGLLAQGYYEGGTGNVCDASRIINCLVEDVDIKGINLSNNSQIGGIAGQLSMKDTDFGVGITTEFRDNEVKNVSVTLSTLGSATDINARIGGAIGYNYGRREVLNTKIDGFSVTLDVPDRTTMVSDSEPVIGGIIGFSEDPGGVVFFDIKHCSVNDLDVRIEPYFWQAYVGGILGQVNHRYAGTWTISECQVANSYILNKGATGGIFGYTQSSNLGNESIKNCSVTGTTLESNLTINPDATTVNQCEVRALVEGSNAPVIPEIGGITGRFAGVVDQCFADVTILENVPNVRTGGIAETTNTTVTNCYSAGSITQTELPRIAQGLPNSVEDRSEVFGIGGSVGTFSTLSTPSHNNISTMTIHAKTDRVAGISGSELSTSNIQDVYSCIAANPIIHTDNGRGFGKTYDDFRRVSASRSTTAGALAWRDNLRHLDTQVFTRGTGSTPPLDDEKTLKGRDGLATSKADLQSPVQSKYEEIYVGWDFEDIWNPPTGTDYPTLRHIGPSEPVGTSGSVGYTNLSDLGADETLIPTLTTRNSGTWAYGARTRCV